MASATVLRNLAHTLRTEASELEAAAGRYQLEADTRRLQAENKRDWANQIDPDRLRMAAPAQGLPS